ncbi:MAG: preprotein translocase subunit YajC [Candidatus Cloacimonetes bacterium]|nr:preprotein translocase subunit YajC [Candidatus Cloacimonadota bacterium]
MYYAILQTGSGQSAQPNLFASLLPFLFIFLIFYFLIIRPQKKRQKDHQNLIDNLKIHDTVITNGGIIGKVVNVKKEKNIIVLRVDESSNTRIEFQRNAIAGIINEEKQG